MEGDRWFCKDCNKIVRFSAKGPLDTVGRHEGADMLHTMEHVSAAAVTAIRAERDAELREVLKVLGGKDSDIGLAGWAHCDEIIRRMKAQPLPAPPKGKGEKG